MIKVILHNQKTGETRYGDENLFTEWTGNPDLWIWADFYNEEPEKESALFGDVFDLHPLAISDAQRDRHPPKLEVFDGYLFLLLQGLDAGTTSIDFKTIQSAFFFGDRFLLTRHRAASTSIGSIWAEVEQGRLNMTQGPTHIVYQIIRRMTNHYTNIVEGFEARLETAEEEMFQNPRDALLEELIGYGRNLKRLRRIFNYHQGIFERLKRKNQPFIKKKGYHEFNDVFEHTERLASLTALYKELTDDLMNGYISVTSHRLNQIMKVLTVVTVIFMPLTVLAGIYGMNFEYMPELKFRNAYFALLGVMGTLVAVLLMLFRKIRWL
ncbi:MAG: magnesium/cobalt transporter CorA [Candidatus Pacearchaeota archaeon]|nr:magnesium/cobalt transporter CorA [Candidatus Pacearchaeota archaeon]